MGIWEIALILVGVFVVFGAGKLPQVMSDLGKGVKGLKQGLKEDQDKKSDTTSQKIVEGEAKDVTDNKS